MKRCRENTERQNRALFQLPEKEINQLEEQQNMFLFLLLRVSVGLILEQTLLISELSGRDRCDNDKDHSLL